MELENEVPEYELTLPDSGEKIRVRPFLVREEKLLLIAAESKDTQEIIRTTKQVIKNCILSEDINVDKLPFFTVDYLYIALRAKSISDTVDITFTCNNPDEDGVPCNQQFPAKIDLGNVSVLGKDIDKVIPVTAKTKIFMQYPTYATMKTIEDAPTQIDKKISLIGSCIKSIHQGEKMYTPGKDMTPAEIKNFLEGLTKQAFMKLEYFIDNLPTFVVNAEAVCPKCNFHHHIQYSEFDNFFF